MSVRDVSLFQDLICDRSGIYLDGNCLDTLREGLRARMDSNGFADHRQYYNFLCAHPAGQRELEELLSHITINETYFFRNAGHFDALRNHILTKFSKENKDGIIRIWSAGCSTGEEPYSIAMIALDMLQDGRDLQIEILGTDVDRSAIDRAERGVYRKRSLRATSDIYKDKYFSENDGRFEVDQKLKDMVRFMPFNLMDAPCPKPSQGSWDIIICRNVVIYFDQESARHVVGMFHGALNDDGYLFMGHSESLDRLSTDFSAISVGDTFVYVKKGSSPDLAEAAAESARRGVPERAIAGRTSSSIARKKDTGPRKQSRRRRKIVPLQPIKSAELIYKEGLDLLECKEFDAALSKAEKYIELKPSDAKGYLLAGKILANRGIYGRAVDELGKAIELEPLLTEAHYLLGVIYQGTGQEARAIDEFRKSVYIDKDCVLSYFHLARIYQSNDMLDDASREYSNAVRILDRLQADEIVQFSGGITARILMQTCLKNIIELSSIEAVAR
jgi:chemotaxis protein methyltransferase CheR